MMETNISNYRLHKEFQEIYQRENPNRECRVQNLLGIYTTTHADNAFDEFCLNKLVDTSSAQL